MLSTKTPHTYTFSVLVNTYKVAGYTQYIHSNTHTHSCTHTHTPMHTHTHTHIPSHIHTHTHPGMFAIRAEREFVIGEDFMKVVRKVSDNKKLVAKMDYKSI